MKQLVVNVHVIVIKIKLLYMYIVIKIKLLYMYIVINCTCTL